MKINACIQVKETHVITALEKFLSSQTECLKPVYSLAVFLIYMMKEALIVRIINLTGTELLTGFVRFSFGTNSTKGSIICPSCECLFDTPLIEECHELIQLFLPYKGLGPSTDSEVEPDVP